MTALDTNVLVRFLVADDAAQARRVRRLFENAEETGERFLVTLPVLLETTWVLSAVYELGRDDVLRALALASEMPILEFEDHETVQQWLRLGASSRADLPDLLIGLVARARGCETTLTFERGLAATGLFRTL